MQPIPAGYDALVREVTDLRRTLDRQDAVLSDQQALIVELRACIARLEAKLTPAKNVVTMRPSMALQRDREAPGAALGISDEDLA